MAICTTAELANLGISRCTGMPQMPKSFIKTAANFRATPVQAVDPAFWQAAIMAGKAERVYKFPDFVNFEDVSEEAIYQQTPLADLFVRPGKYMFRFHIVEGLCTHRAMFTHNGGNARIWMWDIANNLLATELVDGDFAGLNVSLINLEKIKFSDGSVASTSPLYVVLKDSNEIDKNGVLIPADFVGELNRLTDVELTIPVTPATSATAIPVTVKNACDGTDVSGLVLADFVLLTAAGVAQTITSVTESNGVYTINGTAFVDGTLNLVAPAALTVEAYESLAAVAVNVP